MNNLRFYYAMVIILTLSNAQNILGCSMYKITLYGRTMVGSNYDAYYLTSKIWFETAKKSGEYGAVFSGGRPDGNNGNAPQSGMNEKGLAFSGAAVPVSDKQLPGKQNKKQILNRTNFLKDILHTCKTVDEVRDYISQYNCDFLQGDLFMYVDRSGKYLLVESDTMMTGNDPNYLASNFCPSKTAETNALKMDKYRKGVEFLKTGLDTSFAFCTRLSDTMSVCRKRIGDGTLLTSISDLDHGILYYYFYHDYKRPVKFNLREELIKGDHIYAVPSLFPGNLEYQRLERYLTPRNSNFITGLLFFCCAVFFLSSLFFIVSWFRNRNKVHFNIIKLGSFILGLLLAFYTLVLLRTEFIFFFPAPYKSGHPIIDMTSYLPFLLLLVIIPSVFVNLKLWKEHVWGKGIVWLFTTNNLLYSMLIVLFAYWGLYDIF